MTVFILVRQDGQFFVLVDGDGGLIKVSVTLGRELSVTF